MIIFKKDDYYLVKIIKEVIHSFDIYNKDDIEKLFKKIFKKIKRKHTLTGLVDVNVYLNESYGIIMEIKEIFPYPDCVDIQIHFHIDCIFMSEVDFEDIGDNEDIYYYHDKFYKINGNYDSSIIYKDTENILENGIRIC